MKNFVVLALCALSVSCAFADSFDAAEFDAFVRHIRDVVDPNAGFDLESAKNGDVSSVQDVADPDAGFDLESTENGAEQDNVRVRRATCDTITAIFCSGYCAARNEGRGECNDGKCKCVR